MLWCLNFYILLSNLSWLDKTFRPEAKTLLSIRAVQWSHHASACIPGQQNSLILIIKTACDRKAVILVVLGLWLSEGSCPLLEGMPRLWSCLRASIPESGTKPLTMTGAFLGLGHVAWRRWSQKWLFNQQIATKYGSVYQKPTEEIPWPALMEQQLYSNFFCY